MYSSLDSLEADVLNNIEQANFGLALDLIIQFVQYVIRDPKTTAVIFGSERLDRLCLAIGNAMVKKERTPIARDVKTENSESHVVTLATHLERYGGHTLVMEDVSVDSVAYYDMMTREDGLLPTLKRIAPYLKGSRIIIQHDGAKPHNGRGNLERLTD